MGPGYQVLREEAAPDATWPSPEGSQARGGVAATPSPKTSRRRLPPDATWLSPEGSQARGGIAATPSPKTSRRRLPPDATDAMWLPPPPRGGIRPEVGRRPPPPVTRGRAPPTPSLGHHVRWVRCPPLGTHLPAFMVSRAVAPCGMQCTQPVCDRSNDR
ncbi:hypothetical protein [Oryza sativa Japonica Group]|uniref:Uncharacterized protein n=1 Tax=Oryza sativa subsp. japonica TaxID=39947 RepID=Q5ZDJ5_ORYSJ|nr:hypothetical protein [Oryza sativa Japonica Group]